MDSADITEETGDENIEQNELINEPVIIQRKNRTEILHTTHAEFTIIGNSRKYRYFPEFQKYLILKESMSIGSAVFFFLSIQNAINNYSHQL